MATATRKPKKEKSLAKCRDDVAVLLQKLVRMKAADDNGYCQCVTCGKFDHYKNMQGGHFIERGKTATKIIEENINPQCAYCNQWGMKNASIVLAYNEWMVDMHGVDYVEWLRREARRVAKHTRSELEGMRLDITARITEQEARLGV